MITAGPSDVMLAKHAERWLYDWLLRNKIELDEYQPVVLHAKVAAGDGEWFTIGSYNIINVSAYSGIELNLDVYNPELAPNTEQVIGDLVVKDCLPVTITNHARSKNI